MELLEFIKFETISILLLVVQMLLKFYIFLILLLTHILQQIQASRIVGEFLELMNKTEQITLEV